MGGSKIIGHLFLIYSIDAYWFTKVRVIQKNVIYSFQGLILSNAPILSSICLRSPTEISIKDGTAKCVVSAEGWTRAFRKQFLRDLNTYLWLSTVTWKGSKDQTGS